jgi:biopolymer transport protein ExbD
VSGGIVTRLIDIVLILLFGFISISEIDRKSPVRLSETKELPVISVDKEQILVVGVIAPNNYMIEKEDGVYFNNLESLFRYLDVQKADFEHRKKEMKVRVRSNWYLPVKYALDIALYCEHIGVERGLDVRISASK